MKKSFAILLTTALLATSALAGCGKSGSGNKIQIVVDGGGVAGNYNSSISMTPSPANPNPYNQLELLAKEWSDANDTYEIKINRNSMNGNRDTILGYLSTSSGPDIIYQTGTTIAEDMEKNYFVDMTDYLQGPNKYAEGNEKWADLYDPQELEASRAPNGNFYSVGIDRNVAGVMYNEEILTAAGVELPIKTYGEFVEAQDKIQAYSDSNGLEIIPYSMVDNWYDIVLESSLYGSLADEYDVIRKNGIVDTEELCRASYLGKYKIMNGSNVDARYESLSQPYEARAAAYARGLERKHCRHRVHERQGGYGFLSRKEHGAGATAKESGKAGRHGLSRADAERHRRILGRGGRDDRRKGRAPRHFRYRNGLVDHECRDEERDGGSLRRFPAIRHRASE